MENNCISNSDGNHNKKSACSVVSLILSAAPLAIFLLGFAFCLVVAYVVPNADSVIWWLLIAMIPILVPVTIVTSILSVIFGIIGLRAKKTVFAWAGIGFVLIDILVALLVLAFLLL